MVPELSLFMPGQSQTRQPSVLSPSHGQLPARNYQPPPHPSSFNLAPQSDPPPHPHLPPSHHLVPQSDLSREFHRSEATLFLSGSSDVPVRRVQFQADPPCNSGVGIGHGLQVGQGSPVLSEGQKLGDDHGDRLGFPDNVQQLNHHGVQKHLRSNLEAIPPKVPQPASRPQIYNHNRDAPLASVVSQENQPHVTGAPPHLPNNLSPDIMSVLTWQNDQLAKLQDQVAKLLAASPQGQAHHANPPHNYDQGSVSVRQSVTESTSSPTLKKGAQPSYHSEKVSVSTSTSTLFSDKQQTSDNFSKNEKPLQGASQDCPEYPTTPSCSSSGKNNGRVDMNTWDSPVLGESASMYLSNAREKEQEDVEIMYENILGQVKRLLAQDEVQYQKPVDEGGVVVGSYNAGQPQQQRPIQQNITPFTFQRQEFTTPVTPDRQRYPPENVSPVLDHTPAINYPGENYPPTNIPRHENTLPMNTQVQGYALPMNMNCVRQEFSPSNLSQDRPPSGRQEGMTAEPSNTETLERLRQLGVSFISPSDLAPATPAANPYNSIFLPRANLPSTTLTSPSPDTSLAINNLALKYLSDGELAKLAGHHNRQASKMPHNQEERPAEYSLASHQFLARYGLGSEQGQRQQPPSLPARPPHPNMKQVMRPVLDRVLDITAIRNQSKLGEIKE